MRQSIGLVSFVVRDYDEALEFFVGRLGFTLVEDTYAPEQSKRWVVVSPPGARESRLLLARASSREQEARAGAQTGGRVFLFLYTDDFWRDYERFKAKGVSLFVLPSRSRTAPLPYSKISTATCGTFCSQADLFQRKGDWWEGVSSWYGTAHPEDRTRLPRSRPLGRPRLSAWQTIWSKPHRDGTGAGGDRRPPESTCAYPHRRDAWEPADPHPALL